MTKPPIVVEFQRVSEIDFEKKGLLMKDLSLRNIESGAQDCSRNKAQIEESQHKPIYAAAYLVPLFVAGVVSAIAAIIWLF